ncbi:thioesterase domain-containing protein [Kitasatospora cineracea]
MDSYEHSVLAAWRSVMAGTIRRDSNFFSEGGSSVGAARVTAQLRRALAQNYPLSLLVQYPVFADFVQVIRENSSESLPALRFRAGPGQADAASRRSAWIHAGGGEIMFLRAISESLPEIDFLGVRDVDWDRSPDRITPLAVPEQAASYHDVIAAHGDYPHIAGYSSGSVLAYEVAALRKAAGLTVAPPLLIDPPILGPADTRPSYEEVLAEFVGVSEEAASDPAGHPDEWSRALARRSPAGALPEHGYEEWLAHMCRISAKWLWALRHYEPTHSSMPVHLVMSSSRPDLDNSLSDWSRLCGETSVVHMIDASHNDIISHPDLPAVIDDWTSSN